MRENPKPGVRQARRDVAEIFENSEKRGRKLRSGDYQATKDLLENTKYRFSIRDRKKQIAEDFSLRLAGDFCRLLKSAPKKDLPKSQVMELGQLAAGTALKVQKKYNELLETSKSIYILAKENGMDFKKLLRTLRILNFPLEQITKGRQGNFVLGSHIHLFNSIMPSIKTLWTCDETRGEWIRLLKKKGWSSSRVSKFMSRRIKDGMVPAYFFEAVSPDDSPRLTSNLVKRKKVPNILEPLGLKNPTEYTCQAKIKKLREFIRQSTQTLLEKERNQPQLAKPHSINR